MKFKIEEFENDLYQIKDTPNKNFSLMFIDFQYSNTNTNTNVIGPNVFQKTSQLNKMVFYNSKGLTIEHIKNELNKEFIKKVTELGEKNRDNAPPKFDLYVDEWRRKDSPSFMGDYDNEESRDHGIARRIVAKINNISNYIATTARVGPAQYLLSNIRTYNFILNYLKDYILFKDNQLFIGGIKYVVDNNVEDDIIVVGRKNALDQPGVHCVLLTDENGYVNVYEHADPINFNTNAVLGYAIIDVGFNPEYHYFKMKTRSLAYYRNQKLQKIKQIYGEGL